MSGDTQTKTIPIYIDSNDRDKVLSKSSTDFVMTLHKTLRNVRRVDIATVETEHSWYNINVNNNSILLFFKLNGVDSIGRISIPVGEYNTETLRAALELAFNTAGGSWTITFNSFTFKYTINYPSFVNSPQGLSNFYIVPSGYLGTMMGFTSDVIEIKSTFTSDSIVSVNPHKYLFIKSLALANNINTSYITSFRKPFILEGNNNVIAFIVPSIHSNLLYPIQVPYLGSYSIEQIIIILEIMLNFGAGYYGIRSWSVILNKDTKKMTISNNTHPFYVESTDTLSSKLLNIPISTTFVPALSQTSNEINFAMHKNVIAKVNVLNTNFATQHVYNALTISQENDYGKSINLDSIDFQLVDIYDRAMDLNGKGISFSLLVSGNI